MATPKKPEIVIVPDTPVDDSLIPKQARLTSDGIKQGCLTTAPVLSDLNREIPWYEKRIKPRLERDDMKVSKRSLAPNVVDLTSETPEKIRGETFSIPDIEFEFKRNHSIEPMKRENVASFYQKFDADDIKPVKQNGHAKSNEELDNDPLLDMDDEIGQLRRLKRKADVIKPIDVVQIDIDPEIEILEEEQDETVVEVLETMNTVSKSDLCNLLNCNLEQAEMIKKQCPILKLEQISSLKEFKLIKKYLDIQRHFQSVNDVISHCERVGGEIKSILDCWAEDSIIDCGFECLKEQPSFVNSKLNLKPYQLVGVSWMLMLQEKQLGGILADEMGLGKTAQVVSFLGSLKDNRLPDLRALIVVPSSTLENWMRELDLWCPFLVKASYSGSAKERRMLQYDFLDSDFNVIITTYAIATSQPEDRRFLRKLKCDVLVLDEGHMIKNNSSNRSKHLSGFKIPFKLLITGTPIQNNLLELLNLLTFINPELFNDAFSVFTNIFNNQVESVDDLERALVKEKIARASKILQPFILRRKKEDVSRDLPPKTQLVEYIGPSAAQKALVQKIMVRSRKEYLSTKQPDAANNKLHNVVMQLRKAAGHELLFRNLYNEEHIKTLAKLLKREPYYSNLRLNEVEQELSMMSDFEIHKVCTNFDRTIEFGLESDKWMESGKIVLLSTLLPKLIRRGDKILLFSQFVMILDVLELVMETMQIKFLRLDGTTPSSERMELIDSYNNNEDIKVFLLSTKATGLGINLTSANVVILYDIDFNPHNDAQAEDRAHRVGQVRPVTVYRLILEGSIEQHMLQNANAKLLLDQKVQGNDNENIDTTSTVLDWLKTDIVNLDCE